MSDGVKWATANVDRTTWVVSVFGDESDDVSHKLEFDRELIAREFVTQIAPFIKGARSIYLQRHEYVVRDEKFKLAVWTKDAGWEVHSEV